jgi:hypothetical protein
MTKKQKHGGSKKSMVNGNECGYGYKIERNYSYSTPTSAMRGVAC